jgi:hypothetical protein
MSILIRYQPSSLTRDKYDQVNEALQGQGTGEMPEECELHVLFGEEPNMLVSEIWSSEQDWRGFWDGALKKALSDAGVELASDPAMFAVHEFNGSRLSQ